METSQLVCSANQLAGFYMMRTLFAKGLIFSGIGHRWQWHGIYGGYYVLHCPVFFLSFDTFLRGYFVKFIKIVNWYSTSKNPCSKYSHLKICRNIDRIGCWTLVRQRPMKSFSSFCLSVRLKFGSLFFSDIVHGDSWPWYLVTNAARYLKIKFGDQNLGPTGLNKG